MKRSGSYTLIPREEFETPREGEAFIYIDYWCDMTESNEIIFYRLEPGFNNSLQGHQDEKAAKRMIERKMNNSNYPGKKVVKVPALYIPIHLKREIKS